MTIASEITRLQGAKASAKASIISKGVNVPDNASIADYHTYIDQIDTTPAPIEITGANVYGGIYSVGTHQDILGIDGCVSYNTGNVILIGYMGSRQTYDNYDQKDVHFIRWKAGASRKASGTDIGTGTSYTFRNDGLYITKESDDSYLFTANARYLTDGTNDWYYVAKIRYTVSTDTFTIVSSGGGQSHPQNDNMNLYSSSYETSGNSRVALFTLRN